MGLWWGGGGHWLLMCWVLLLIAGGRGDAVGAGPVAKFCRHFAPNHKRLLLLLLLDVGLLLLGRGSRCLPLPLLRPRRRSS